MASRQAVLPANGARLSVQGIGSGVFDNKRYRGLGELMIRVYLHCEDIGFITLKPVEIIVEDRVAGCRWGGKIRIKKGAGLCMGCGVVCLVG